MTGIFPLTGNKRQGWPNCQLLSRRASKHMRVMLLAETTIDVQESRDSLDRVYLSFGHGELYLCRSPQRAIVILGLPAAKDGLSGRTSAQRDTIRHPDYHFCLNTQST